MNLRICSRSFLFVIPWILFAGQVQAQDTTAINKSIFSISKGTILTGFSIDGITASRDDYNHEFERAFSRLRINMEGFYFIDDRLGIGPILGYEYQFRDFEDPSGFFESSDQWSWKLLYGARAGWFIPVKNLFFSYGINKVHPLSNTYLFVNGGVSWLWSKYRMEEQGTIEDENRFGYQLGGGLLVPVGKKISLEWKLGWEARRERYQFGIIKNGQVVEEFDEVKWLKEFSVGLGFKVTL